MVLIIIRTLEHKYFSPFHNNYHTHAGTRAHISHGRSLAHTLPVTYPTPAQSPAEPPRALVASCANLKLDALLLAYLAILLHLLDLLFFLATEFHIRARENIENRKFFFAQILCNPALLLLV